MLELLVLKNAAQRTNQRVKWMSTARVNYHHLQLFYLQMVFFLVTEHWSVLELLV